MDTPIIEIYDLGEYGHVDEDGNMIWARTSFSTDPTEARLAALEMQMIELDRKIENLTAYVRALMTNEQRLRCAIPHSKP